MLTLSPADAAELATRALAACGTSPEKRGVHHSCRGTLQALLACADVVRLHTSLTPPMIDVETLAEMMRGAILINVARGILDEAAPVAARQAGHLAGAALDVLGA